MIYKREIVKQLGRDYCTARIVVFTIGIIVPIVFVTSILLCIHFLGGVNLFENSGTIVAFGFMIFFMAVVPSGIFAFLLIRHFKRFKDPLFAGCQVYANYAKMELANKNKSSKKYRSLFNSDQLYQLLQKEETVEYYGPSQTTLLPKIVLRQSSSSNHMSSGKNKQNSNEDPDEEIEEYLNGKRDINKMSSKALDVFFEDYDGD